MADPRLLVWVDLETTGVDEQWDGIMEMAAIVTDLELQELGRTESAIQITPFQYERLASNAFVFQMHENSGLEALCATSPWDIERMDIETAEWLSHFAMPGEFMLAGSGVGHFDRRFIRRWMPMVEQYLQYPVLDVGVLRRALRMWGDFDPGINEGKEHRAMSDIELHLAEGRAYRSLMRQSVLERTPSRKEG